MKPSRSWGVLILFAFVAALLFWKNYKDNVTIGYYLLGFSVLLTIAGIGMFFDKKGNEQIQKYLISELPERSALIGAPDAMKIVRRRGYITIAIGIVMFITWLEVFGISSLAIGV